MIKNKLKKLLTTAVAFSLICAMIISNNSATEKRCIEEQLNSATAYLELVDNAEIVDLAEATVEARKRAEELEKRKTMGGVMTPSNLSPEELSDGLLYDMKNYADVFVKAEEETGISAVFLSAVAGYESGWGRSNVSAVHNNLFGWTSSSGYAVFDSKESCIMNVAYRLKDLYLSEDGVYFNGYTVSAVNENYNGSECWENNVTQIMSEIEGRIEES